MGEGRKGETDPIIQGFSKAESSEPCSKGSKKPLNVFKQGSYEPNLHFEVISLASVG